MNNYQNDQPITGSINNPDRLNREKFAIYLTEILTIDPSEDCFTVSLEGDWGYGKTSVVNLVKKTVKNERNKPIIIQYNPWLAGKAEALIQDFLVQFSSQLNIPDRPKDCLKAAKELLAYSHLFNAIKFVPGAEPWASTIQGAFKIFGTATKKISKLKELDLLARKNKVKEVLSSLNQSIIVIIDDIDRLIPDEAYQIVRLVKAVADFPGTSFLLCFDPEYLTAALEKHGIKKSDQYVDKIVQLRVPLPLITHRDMQKLSDIEFTNLSDRSLTDHFEEDQERLSILYHQHIKYLIRTPRELKRIFNNLRFVLKQTEGMVCFTDLLCLSVISIKAQLIYQSIKDSPQMYVGMSFDDNYSFDKSEDVIKKYADERNKYIKKCADKDKDHIHGLLKELFPLLDESGFPFHGKEYDQSGRVASEKRLHIAMHYQVPTGFAADSDIRNFIDGKIDRATYLKKAIEDGFVERFFELIHHNIEKINDSQINGILNSLYSIFLHSKYISAFENSRVGFFEFDPFQNITWVTYKLIEKIEGKLLLIKTLVENQNYLPATTDIIRRLMVQNEEIKSDDPKLIKEKWVQSDEFKDIKQKWIQTAINEIDKGSLLESAHASHVFFVLYRAAEDKVKELFEQWIRQDNGIEKIARLIGRSGVDSTNGPYCRIEKDFISKFIDYKTIKERVDKELSSGKELSNYLKAVYLSISTEDTYYLNDASKGQKF